jgi:hypothetical protein
VIVRPGIAVPEAALAGPAGILLCALRVPLTMVYLACTRITRFLFGMKPQPARVR